MSEVLNEGLGGERTLRGELRRQGQAGVATGPTIRDSHVHGCPAAPVEIRRGSRRAMRTSFEMRAAGPAMTRFARSSFRTSCWAPANGSSSTTRICGMELFTDEDHARSARQQPEDQQRSTARPGATAGQVPGRPRANSWIGSRSRSHPEA